MHVHRSDRLWVQSKIRSNPIGAPPLQAFRTTFLVEVRRIGISIGNRCCHFLATAGTGE
jgi:hypothetical protein